MEPVEKGRAGRDKTGEKYIFSHCYDALEAVTNEDIPSLGMMFFTMKASHAPGVKTPFHGCRMRRAEASLGCHRCKALDSLLLIGG